MISYGGVNLWKLEQPDLADHNRWANDDTLRRLAGWPPGPRSQAELVAWFNTVISDPAQEVFSLKSFSAEHLGWVHFSEVDLVNGTASVGIALDPRFWGKGFAHDGLAAALKFAFEDLRLHRLEAEIIAINLPSIKLFTRLGFVKEGVKRESYFTRGRHLDVLSFGLLASEYVNPTPVTAEPETPEPEGADG